MNIAFVDVLHVCGHVQAHPIKVWDERKRRMVVIPEDDRENYPRGKRGTVNHWKDRLCKACHTHEQNIRQRDRMLMTA